VPNVNFDKNIIMQKTLFSVSQMDCASEEQMVRLKLDDMSTIKSLAFDLKNRRVEIIHSGDYQEIFVKLDSLNLNTKLISTESIDISSEFQQSAVDSKLLWQVLLINLSFFIIEIISGFLGDSMGLVADSLDMLADSFVYGLSLYAIGRTLQHKKNIAIISGYFQLALALFGFIEVIRRFIGFEEIPSFGTMIIVSVFALIGNAISLYLIQKSKSKEVHMQASRIFTSNDVIVNIGVIVAGALVLATNSKYPDLIVGTIIFALVGIGSYRILQLSK
jgi:Co/Zn/Cd efflux system component